MLFPWGWCIFCCCSWRRRTWLSPVRLSFLGGSCCSEGISSSFDSYKFLWFSAPRGLSELLWCGCWLYFSCCWCSCNSLWWCFFWIFCGICGLVGNVCWWVLYSGSWSWWWCSCYMVDWTILFQLSICITVVLFGRLLEGEYFSVVF